MNAPLLLLTRHGESYANRDDRFAGWANECLTDMGKHQAWIVGKELRRLALPVELIYSSVLSRAVQIAQTISHAIATPATRLRSAWRLNERHYRMLTNRSKAEIRRVYGAEQTMLWRHGFDSRPPEVDEDFQGELLRAIPHWHADGRSLPRTESLSDTLGRVQEFWHETVRPEIGSGRTVVLVAHGNSLRVLIALLEQRDCHALHDIAVPNGKLIAYRFDDQMRPERCAAL